MVNSVIFIICFESRNLKGSRSNTHLLRWASFIWWSWSRCKGHVGKMENWHTFFRKLIKGYLYYSAKRKLNTIGDSYNVVVRLATENGNKDGHDSDGQLLPVSAFKWRARVDCCKVIEGGNSTIPVTKLCHATPSNIQPCCRRSWVVQTTRHGTVHCTHLSQVVGQSMTMTMMMMSMFDERRGWAHKLRSLKMFKLIIENRKEERKVKSKSETWLLTWSIDMNPFDLPYHPFFLRFVFFPWISFVIDFLESCMKHVKWMPNVIKTDHHGGWLLKSWEGLPLYCVVTNLIQQKLLIKFGAIVIKEMCFLLIQ